MKTKQKNFLSNLILILIGICSIPCNSCVQKSTTLQSDPINYFVIPLFVGKEWMFAAERKVIGFSHIEAKQIRVRVLGFETSSGSRDTTWKLGVQVDSLTFTSTMRTTDSTIFFFIPHSFSGWPSYHSIYPNFQISRFIDKDTLRSDTLRIIGNLYHATFVHMIGIVNSSDAYSESRQNCAGPTGLCTTNFYSYYRLLY